MSELAQQALAALDDGITLTPEQRLALEEAIRLLRPAPTVKGGQVCPLDQDAAAAFPEWTTFSGAVRPYLSAIGRIDRSRTPGFDPTPVGTGFLISRTLLVTNEHVVAALTMGTNALIPRSAEVRFGQEEGAGEEPLPEPIVEVVAVSAVLDLALLRLEPPEDRPCQPLPLPTEAPIEDGTPVGTVGYPLRTENDPPYVKRLFGTRSGVKRAAPGQVIALRDDQIVHDCSTLPGNSGSPVLALKDVELVAVHAEGKLLHSNRAAAGAAARRFLGQAVTP